MIPADAIYSLPLHPTQIYSAIDAFVLFILLSAYYPLRRRDGEVMGLLMITYPVTRFLIEWLRNDEGVFFAGLTISQNISIVLLLVRIRLLVLALTPASNPPCRQGSRKRFSRADAGCRGFLRAVLRGPR